MAHAQVRKNCIQPGHLHLGHFERAEDGLDVSAAVSTSTMGSCCHRNELAGDDRARCTAQVRADKIVRRLERKGISSTALHSNRTQGQRHRALDGFKEGRYRVLVATDIAARGIDVDGISHVINYDIPQYAEDYIHRIGRTGRAGDTGALFNSRRRRCVPSARAGAVRDAAGVLRDPSHNPGDRAGRRR